MDEKIHLRQAVLVEGRYDKIKLEPLLDALILPVNGFSVFSDRELRELIRTLAAGRGIVILTDSDAAGFRIRTFLKNLVPAGQVTDVYIPDIYGKEHRKETPSKEGKLGVEGMTLPVLREAFRRAGIAEGAPEPHTDPITRADFYQDGFAGGPHSRTLRYALYDRLGLPHRLNVTAAVDVINRLLTREEYRQAVGQIHTQHPHPGGE